MLDSSCWIEHVIGSVRGEAYRPLINDVDSVLVPTICVYEVTRWLVRNHPPEASELARVQLRRCQAIPLNSNLAEQAAILALKLKLALADSIIYATAQFFDAELWTQDAHFDNLTGVRYFAG